MATKTSSRIDDIHRIFADYRKAMSSLRKQAPAKPACGPKGYAWCDPARNGESPHFCCAAWRILDGSSPAVDRRTFSEVLRRYNAGPDSDAVYYEYADASLDAKYRAKKLPIWERLNKLEALEDLLYAVTQRQQDIVEIRRVDSEIRKVGSAERALGLSDLLCPWKTLPLA